MKRSLLAATFFTLTALPALAQQAPSMFSGEGFKTICEKGVTAHPRKAGFWHLAYPRFAVTAQTLFATVQLQPNEAGQFAILTIDKDQPNESKELVRFKNRVQDLAYHDNILWALFSNRLAALQPSTGEVMYEVLTADDQPTDDAKAHAFAWVGDQLVIAHGVRGTRVFNPATRTLSDYNRLDMYTKGQLSKTIDVTALSSTEALFAVENVSVSNDPPFPFEGLISMNVADQSVSGRFAYDRKESGSISNAVIKVWNENVLINNWGTLQTVSFKSLQQNQKVLTTWKPTRVDIDGVKRTVELLGEPLVFGNELVSCGHLTYQNAESRKIIHQGVVYRTAL